MLSHGSASAQRMRDVFATSPDSIFPLLTLNNRLDCIDFIENNMAARVKNRFDTYSELKVLTDDYLLLQATPKSQVEMKLFQRAEQGDTILCLVHTVESSGASDSAVRFYSLDWKVLDIVAPCPPATSFMDEDIHADARDFLCDLTLIKASLSATKSTITWELQTSPLAPDLREDASRKVHPIETDL